NVLADLRYAARQLARSPGFTLGVVLTLALGIGANVAMFSIIDRMLFRPPPLLHDAGATHRIYLAQTWSGKEQAGGYMQYARYVDLTKWTTAFARTAAFTEQDLAIGVGTEAREMRVGIVSAGFFGFFDAPPALGRYFTTSEDSPPTGTAVAVLAYAFWQTQYGGHKDVLGSTLQIGPTLYTIIGVAPEGFVGLWPVQRPAAFIPITSHASAMAAGRRGETWWTTYHWQWLSMLAQRKSGVSVAAANADLSNAFLRSYAAQRSGSSSMTPAEIARPRAFVASVLSERGPNESSFAKVATWISGVALIVLLIACANVANLLLARALRRRREIAVRLALGVSRARLLSQLFTESVLLALLGGLAGLIVADWGGAVLRAQFLAKSSDVSVLSDARTLLFGGVAALATGLLTGLAPALLSRRTDVAGDLKAGAREGTFQRSRMRIALLVLQGALSVVLLVGAGLFVRSLRNVRVIPLGYDVDPVLLVGMNLRGTELDSARNVALRRELLDAAQAIPGVEHASLQLTVPFWLTWDLDLHVAGIDSVGRLGEFYLNAVTPEYFATLGTHILRGRGIESQDGEHAPRVMVVSQAMAKTLWPGRDPIGQCVKVDADTAPCSYVVGVAENIKSQQLGDDPGLLYYLSTAQWHPEQGGLFIRTRGDAPRYAETIRRSLQPVMPGAAYVTVTPLRDILGEQTRSWQMGATMFLAFGALALALAAIGLYSVMAYNVAQRTQELGVRAALGAQQRDLIRLVVNEGLKVGVVGIVIGVVIALAGGQWLGPLLFQESPHDPLVFGGVTLVLLGTTVLASFVPSRRAARVDPMVALRYE
ncbi:MAG TPA: ADOP family duplicated permease, partial [Gemmatimonadales bacterium]|nr:ADOP family duplicated permease [Gemmatimonadales bacterium]